MLRIYSVAPVFTASLFALAVGFGALPRSASVQDRAGVVLVADGKSRPLITTSAATVSEVLAEAGISLGPLDRVSPSPESPVAGDMEIRVTRVTREHVTEEVKVQSRTMILADSGKPAGFTKVLESPQDGRTRRVVRVWRKEGEITLRQVIKEKVLARPRDGVVLRGTRGLSSRGGDWRSPRRMETTAYDPGPGSCGKYADGYTATGVRARKGVAAVDDRVIPMGTRLYIPGYGFAIAADRGSAIKGNRLDLCFDTRAEALRWGRRRLKVYVLD